MDKVDKLYQNYDVLADPNNKPSEHEDLYLEIIQSVKGETSEKMLACQFIPRFLKDFPKLTETALDAQLDLVEDEDVAIRKHAVKHLPAFCKENKEFITKVSDILTQMLQSEDTAEVATIHTALMTIFKLDIKATLAGIFVQIQSTDEEAIRKRAIQFLCTKFKHLPGELITKEVEEFVLEKCKEAFVDICGEDFLNLMPLLSNLKIAKTIPVQQTFVSLIAEQAELEDEFQPTIDNIAGFLQCVRLALPYFSQFISSTAFASFICKSVLSRLKEIEALEGGTELSLDVIKLLAEISVFVSEGDHNKECVEIIHKVLLEYLPLPPPESENGSAEEPNLQFTHIECLLFTFTHLLKHFPEFLTAGDNSQRFKDLKTRLQFLARGVQSGIKTFRESLVADKSKDAKVEETKMKAMALRTMNNINTLVKDLFRTPPTFKTSVTLSWKLSSNDGPMKRSSTDGNGHSDAKQPRRESKSGRELYQPPGGKYSTNVNSFRPSRGGSSYFPRGRGRRFY